MFSYGSSSFNQFLWECGTTGVEVRGSGDGPMKDDGLSGPLAQEVWKVCFEVPPSISISDFPQKDITCECCE